MLVKAHVGAPAATRTSFATPDSWLSEIVVTLDSAGSPAQQPEGFATQNDPSMYSDSPSATNCAKNVGQGQSSAAQCPIEQRQGTRWPVD